MQNEPVLWLLNFLSSDSRRTLFLLKLGSFQFAVLKLAFTVLSVVLYTNGTFDLSDVSPEHHITSHTFKFCSDSHAIIFFQPEMISLREWLTSAESVKVSFCLS